MDIQQIYSDYSIDHRTSGHKHTREGWVNVECPWCITDNPGYHLGYNLDGNFFTCWKCGWHPIGSTLARLLKVPEVDIRRITHKYGFLIPRQKKNSIIKVGKKPMHLPSNSLPILENHRKYLINRGFDPDYLEEKYKILGTGPFSKLDKLDYKHRIIIPFIWEEEQVSFDSRDITNKHSYKYMACPAERERISHKEILYGNQESWTDTIIIVEGPTDVWRFGDHSAATSGIKYTPKQVRLIASTFKRVFVCFDSGEPQAAASALSLVAELKFRGIDSRTVFVESGDPGSMSQTNADKFVKMLLEDYVV